MIRIKLIAIIGALSILSISKAQEIGDTKIIVKNELKAEENYRAAASAFLERNFEVLEKDDTFLTATFGPYTYDYQVRRLKYERYMFAAIRAKDGEIVITMQGKHSGQRKREAVYDPDKEVFKVPFEITTDIVKNLGTVSYGR